MNLEVEIGVKSHQVQGKLVHFARSAKQIALSYVYAFSTHLYGTQNEQKHGILSLFKLYCSVLNKQVWSKIYKYIYSFLVWCIAELRDKAKSPYIYLSVFCLNVFCVPAEIKVFARFCSKFCVPIQHILIYHFSIVRSIIGVLLKTVWCFNSHFFCHILL